MDIEDRPRRCRRNAVSNLLPLLQRLGMNPELNAGVGPAVDGSPSAGPAVPPPFGFCGEGEDGDGHGPEFGLGRGRGRGRGLGLAAAAPTGAFEPEGVTVERFTQIPGALARNSSVRSEGSDRDVGERWEELPAGLTRRGSSRHSQRRSAGLPDELGEAAAAIQARAAAGTLGRR
mmetsp:Transcript_26643/g.70063  ORF Transcript_26643/g.70063 Transcript_26643/m.70063 type:complete len:175 (+) Transcript_26643:235-759(+)